MATPLMERIEGKYEILEKMGEGGMGAVYKVRHRILDEIRVIKVMRPHLAADEKLRERFLREAKTAIRLRHPNVAQLHDCTVDEDGNAFMVIEYIEGVTLEQMLRDTGAPPIGLTLEMASQSLKALESLHRKSVVHRDIAPDNLMLSRDDEGEPLVKLIDLGIAKVLESADGGLTGTGMFIGKLRYSSPEHFRTHEGAPVDARSDLYSFGVVLYELLTGTHPIEGESMSSLIAGHLMHPPLEFAKSDPEGRVPEDLRAIVLKALAKDPGHRFQTAADFRRALAPIRERFPIVAADVDRALSAASPPTIRFPAVRKSTTQDELDRQFVPGTTPPPQPTEVTPAPVSRVTASGTVEPPAGKVAAAPPRTPPEAVEIARRVELHLQRGQIDEASQTLADGEARFGSSERLRALKKEVEEARHREEQRRRVDALRAEAAALAGRHDYEGALARLQKGIEIAPADHALRAQIAELEGARQAEEARRAEERRRHIESLLSEAGSLAHHERFDEALARLRQALEIAPSDDSIRARIAEVDNARQRAAAVAQAVALVVRLVGAGDLDRAERELDAAVARLGESAPLLASRRTIEARRAARRERLQQLHALISEGRERLAAGALEEARSRLDRARSLEPGDADVAALAGDLEAAVRAREEEERRQGRIREAVAAISRDIDAGGLASARGLLDKAARQYQKPGETEVFQALGERLDRAELQERAARALAIRQQAAALIDGDRLAEAVKKLEEALAIDGSDRQTVDALTAARHRLRQLEEQRERERAVAVAVRTIESNLARGRLEQAHKEVLSALAEVGEVAALLDLRARVETEVAARREREQRVSALIEEARRQAAAGELEAALERLREADRVDPGSAAVSTLIGEVETALRRRAEERERQHRIAEATARIERHLAGGALADARTELESAEKELGEVDRLALLRRQLDAAEKRAIAERVQRVVSEARQLIEAERFEEAIDRLKTARQLDASDETAAGLVAECQQALAARRREEQRQRRLAERAAGVERLLEAGKIAKAARRLEAAESRLGPDEALAGLRRRIEEAAAAAPAPAEAGRRRLPVPLVIGAAVIVVAVLAVVVQQRRGALGPRETAPEVAPAGAGATCTVLVDAVPWGQVTAIADADGKPRPVPGAAYTPLVLRLPPGSYTITLAHPSRPTPATLRVTLEEGEPVRELVELATPDVSAFFRDMGW